MAKVELTPAPRTLTLRSDARVKTATKKDAKRAIAKPHRTPPGFEPTPRA
jgi:hypothetical protein